MFALGPIGFAAPALLLALLALPVLWFLLRAVPPAPVRRRFPGITLLLGLTDEDNETDRTPWWLLLLRCLAVAAAIIGFAGPILNPLNRAAGSGPMLILFDGSWAAAPVWEPMLERAERALGEAARDGRAVAVVSLTGAVPDALPFQSADAWGPRLAALEPAAWEPGAEDVAALIGAVNNAGAVETIWMSDGLERDGREELLAALQDAGSVRVFQSARAVTALSPARFEGGAITLRALRNQPDGALNLSVAAHGRDPAGTERILARVDAVFDTGMGEAEIALSLPAELRNRITRFAITGSRSAGAVTLTDDGLKRREIALISGARDREGLELLSPLHYLQRALVETADLLDSGLAQALPANPDVIVLADVAEIDGDDAADLLEWVEGGGLLVRFAGPRLAASDVSRSELDPLMPVRLRAGGRTVGGAMSWGEPKALRPFEVGSPFFGLTIPGDVNVTSQVMAQPDPELSSRTIASLADGTPLITRKAVGEGQIVLFHVTANAEWSSLPLSGLFVQMLERLAISTRPARPEAEDLIGTNWTPETLINGFGENVDPGATASVAGERIAEARVARDLPPGLYRSDDQRLALNTITDERVLSAAVWPGSVVVEGLSVARETPLKGFALAAALLLLLLDIAASLWLSGRLRRVRGVGGAVATILAVVFVALAPPAEAQTDDEFAARVTADVVLGYVRTGNAQVDDVALAGLRGLSDRLTRRTSIEPAEPMAVNLETDELSFFPFLYWPVTADQPIPSAEAYGRLNRYLRGGGMILFDTRDADLSRATDTAEGQRLQVLARALDIPALEIVPEDHVLTRTFYLLQDFPGRYDGRNVWVEAAPPDATLVEGMPFRNLNDGVTPVVIGGNDWAAAWAIDANGAPLLPVGRGFTGERQREIAFRFGINLIMHVLTGNYKSDQVHVPALLERLGQ